MPDFRQNYTVYNGPRLLFRFGFSFVLFLPNTVTFSTLPGFLKFVTENVNPREGIEIKDAQYSETIENPSFLI